MSKDKINALCEYLENNKADLYPINNDYLSNTTDFMKNGYLKLLAVILQQGEMITNSQLVLFKRILIGANPELQVDDYLKMALDIEIKDFDDYIYECKKDILKYRLILDSIILIGLEEKNKEQIHLLAQYCEVLCINKDELQYLLDIGKAILEMDIAKYVDAYESNIDLLPYIIFDGYINLMSKKPIYGNEHITIFKPSNPMDITVETLNKIKNISTPCVKLINVELDLSTYPLIFENKESVILESCKFIDGFKYEGTLYERRDCSLKFKNCTNVTINNTEFKDFKSRTIVVENIDNLNILKCNFNNCIYYYFPVSDHWNSLGGVIYSPSPYNIKQFKLDTSIFTDCGGNNRISYYRSEFICNITANVNNCQFINCWHKHNYNNIDPDSGNCTMFTSSSKGTNNKIENSAQFN